MTIRVYLSGGPEGQRWGNGLTKAEIAKTLRALNRNIEIITSGKADYIVIPNAVSSASANALKTGGTVKNYTAFVAMMKRRKASSSPQSKKSTKKTASRKKTVTKKKTTSRKKNSTKKTQSHKKKSLTALHKKKSSKKTASRKKKSSKKTASRKKKSSKRPASRKKKSRKKTASRKKKSFKKAYRASHKKKSIKKTDSRRGKKSTASRKQTATKKSGSNKKNASVHKASAKKASARKASVTKPASARKASAAKVASRTTPQRIMRILKQKTLAHGNKANLPHLRLWVPTQSVWNAEYAKGMVVRNKADFIEKLHDIAHRETLVKKFLISWVHKDSDFVLVPNAADITDEARASGGMVVHPDVFLEVLVNYEP